MGNAIESALFGSAPESRTGFKDGLGDRVVVPGSTPGEQLEVLSLRPELTSVSSFEFALRERAARLANFQHESFARVRQIDRVRVPHERLSVVSEHVAGWRLCEILDAAHERGLQLDINASLSLLTQLVHAAAILHQQARGVAHGALAPERIVITPHARVVVVEYVLGSALERLELTRERLWRELRIAVPPAAGASRFDRRADVTQLGTVALALVLGRRLGADEYPHRVGELLATATENHGLGGRQPLSPGLRAWLARALQLDFRTSFQSAVDAEAALDTLLTEEHSYVAAPVALETFLASYQRTLTGGDTSTADGAATDEDQQSVETPPVVHASHWDLGDEDESEMDLLAPVFTETVGRGDAPSSSGSPAHADVPITELSQRDEVVDLAALDAATQGESRGGVEGREGIEGRGGTEAKGGIEGGGGTEGREGIEGRGGMEARGGIEGGGGVEGRRGTAGVAEGATSSLDLAQGYPGGFESLFGSPAGATDAEDDRADGRRKPRSMRVRLAIAATAVIALGAGGYPAVGWLLTSKPVVTTGTLNVESQPSGLTVKIDGTARGVTPLKIALAAGPHKIQLDTTGEPRVIPITMTAGGQVSQYIEATTAPVTGRLQITSEPAGATVSVDGVRKGIAPLIVADLSVGRHRVDLQSDAGSAQQEVAVEAGMTNSLVVPLTRPSGPVSGWVSVKAPVELQVYEGGQLVGTSQTDRILMTAGRHELDMVNETLGYRGRQSVVVPPGKMAGFSVQMPKGTLNVNAVPWAEVFIDGERAGETPIGNLALPIGPHEIVFRHPQFGEQRHAVTVTMKATARVSVDLRK